MLRLILIISLVIALYEILETGLECFLIEWSSVYKLLYNCFTLAVDTVTAVDATYLPDTTNSQTYDVVEKLDPQTFNNLGIASAFDLSIDLTCSISGTPAITFVKSSYNSETVPAWVTLDSANSKLTGTTPTVTATTTYNFYIDATSGSWSGVKQKQITLVIN